MKLALLVLLVAARSRDTPSIRSRDKLVQEIGDFATQARRGGPPQPGDMKDVRPPSEEELRWLKDASDHDPLERQILGIRLAQQCRQIADVYAAQHRPEAAGWLVAAIDVYANMADVVVDELQTDADPKVAELGTHDLGELAGMSVDLAEVDLRNLAQLPVAVHLQVIAGWHARVAKLRRLWTQGECDKVAGMIAVRVVGETDRDVKKALQDLASELHDCKGRGR
jgi:hypothetical protein